MAGGWNSKDALCEEHIFRDTRFEAEAERLKDLWYAEWLEEMKNGPSRAVCGHAKGSLRDRGGASMSLTRSHKCPGLRLYHENFDVRLHCGSYCCGNCISNSRTLCGRRAVIHGMRQPKISRVSLGIGAINGLQESQPRHYGVQRLIFFICGVSHQLDAYCIVRHRFQPFLPSILPLRPRGLQEGS
jgi:hypothetical protein